MGNENLEFMTVDRFELMLKEKVVARVNMSTPEVKIVEPEMMPLGLRGKNASMYELAMWLMERCVHDRENSDKLFKVYGLKNSQPSIQKMFISRAVSLSDCYWIRLKESEIWDEINVKRKILPIEYKDAAVFGKVSHCDNPITPEWTLNGSTKKFWLNNGKDIMLCKVASNMDELKRIRSEVIASIIMSKASSCLSIYSIYQESANEENTGITGSITKNPANDDVSVVSLKEYVDFFKRNGYYNEEEDELFYVIDRLNPIIAQSLIISDFIVGNSSRSLYNTALLISNDDGHILNMCYHFNFYNAFMAKDNFKSIFFKNATLYRASKNKFQRPFISR